MIGLETLYVSDDLENAEADLARIQREHKFETPRELIRAARKETPYSEDVVRTALLGLRRRGEVYFPVTYAAS